MPPSADPATTPRRLRLLIVTDEMEVGGTQRQIVHLARGLDPARFEVTVLYFRNRSHFVDQLEAAGVRVVQIEKHGRLDLRFVARLVAFVARGHFDVIHAFALPAFGLKTDAIPGSTIPSMMQSAATWYSIPVQTSSQ